MKRFGATLAVALVAALLPAGDALAAPARVRLSIEAADTTVSANDTIVIKGKASSKRRACRKNKTVTLMIDGAPYGTDQTSARGIYRFEVPGQHPPGQHKFSTRIPASSRCKASRPNTVTVTVN